SAAPPAGMRDFLPADTALRDWATGVIVRTYEQFGFTRIETPALENIALLRGGEGGENLKLIFEILKRGEKLERELTAGNPRREDLADLGLRFDLTVPLVRFYAHNQSTLPNPLKSIQIGSVWRAESPQQGRYRQFTQCDIDMFGVKSEVCEMELLQATAQALLELGFKDFTIRINDRRILSELASNLGFESSKVDNMFITLDKLDKVGVKGVEAELSRHEHNRDAIDRLLAILQQLESAGPDYKSVRACLPADLNDDGAFDRLERIIDAITLISNGMFSAKFDPTLVRGMGYYTGPIFEISQPGYSSSIAGGGRYDKMVGKFAGRDTPACGFSIGFERIISILQDKNFQPPGQAEKIALIFDPDRDTLKDVLAVSQRLRHRGLIVSMQPRKKDMRKQLDNLVAQGFTSYASFRQGNDQVEIKELNQSPL
ncbi:MAG TPA: histidine--tRNA ligase, partial [Chroococcales cyanobacterium]